MNDFLEKSNYSNSYWDNLLEQKIDSSNMIYNDTGCKGFLLFPNFGF